MPLSIIWYSSTARSPGGRSHIDSRASSGQIATRRASAPYSRRRVRSALTRASGPPLQSSTISSGRGLRAGPGRAGGRR